MRASVVAIIPARWGSSRFPGKPLAQVAGVPMIVRVTQRVAACTRIDQVIVATDDARIAQVVNTHGLTSVMTPADLPSGTDRVAWVVNAWNDLSETRHSGGTPHIVLNVQGDEPLIEAVDLAALIDLIQKRPDGVATLMRPLLSAADFVNPHVVKLVRAADRALYFSRAPIPHGALGSPSGAWQHLGVYAFRSDVLLQFVKFPVANLEITERLEQLRALENNMPVYVTEAVSHGPSHAVDTPQDLEYVEHLLLKQTKREG